MPIRAELRHLYGREWKTVTRPRILLRAKNRCEQCGVPNHQAVLRAAGWWTPYGDTREAMRYWGQRDWSNPDLIELFWTPPSGEAGALHGFPVISTRLVVIRLTIAHLNHKSGDDRDANLKALCQWCHLNYDKLHHHQTRATRKDRARPLLAKAAEPYQVTVDEFIKETL